MQVPTTNLPAPHQMEDAEVKVKMKMNLAV
jgi:hypothetical protein